MTMNEKFLLRKIIHLDMDCFYAAVEMREQPWLIGHPIAVGGDGPRSVITTCNYEARRFGIHSGMSGRLAKKKCPILRFLPVRMELYEQEAVRLRALFREYTPLVEPLALDEAFLDVTNHSRYAWDLAKELRARIIKSTGLSASAGIAPNKMLAKIASEWRKPNGQFAILPHEIPTFMALLPIEKIWGIGPKSAQRLHSSGIRSCGDLQRLSLLQMTEQFGKWGRELYYLARGEDHREVVTHRIAKSLSHEKTFPQDLMTLRASSQAMHALASEMLLEYHLKAPERSIHKAFIKIKFADFKKITKEFSCSQANEATYQWLLQEVYQRNQQPIRLLGAGIRFAEEKKFFQAELF